MQKFDLIGDIHGHAEELKLLLDKLGYERKDGVYRHSEGRRVLFVGDYIDRGPQIPEVLEIVKAMVTAGQAIALMGNHEFNAIQFNLKKEGGGYRRAHTIKNFKQHHQTLLQFEKSQEAYDESITWFKSLPLYYEDENFRAIHACWDSQLIKQIQPFLNEDRSLKEEHWPEAGKKGSLLYELIDDLLKGKEAALPEGKHFHDKDGAVREKIRVAWWNNPADLKSLEEYSVIKGLDGLDQVPLTSEMKSTAYYDPKDKPVFFGHYWLTGTVQLSTSNACCLDYSVARGGELVAYRYEGEKELREESLIWV
jgi:hypothetical protein